jgi:hypothetical protein
VAVLAVDVDRLRLYFGRYDRYLTSEQFLTMTF